MENEDDNNLNDSILSHDPDLFFNVLQREFPSLMSMLIDNSNLTILVPSRHLITPRMLHRHFYENHIIYVSPYDEGKSINLNGKVLKVEDTLFTGIIGWNKPVQFTSKEKIVRSFGSNEMSIEYFAIDNLCDDFHYKTKQSKEEQSDITLFPMSVFPIQEAYIGYYYQATFSSIKEYLTAEQFLDNFLEMMSNHYMLTQGNEKIYFNIFKNKLEPVINTFKDAIRTSFKVDNTLFDQVICELVQSLIFTKKNYYNMIMDRLIDLAENEEQFLREKLIENKNDYSAEIMLGSRYKEFELTEAITMMNELTDKITYFEKNLIYKRINEFFEMSIIEIDAKNKCSNKEIGADMYINLWTLLLSRWPINNLIAEINFYVFYSSSFAKQFDANYYYSATIETALGKLRKDVEIKNGIAVYHLNQKIKQTVIKIDTTRMKDVVSQNLRLSTGLRKVNSRQSNS